MNKTTRIIAIEGPYGSGKSAVANKLRDAINKLDYVIYYRPFAEHTKAVITANYGWRKGGSLARQEIEEYSEFVVRRYGDRLINTWKDSVPDDADYVIADDLLFPCFADMIVDELGAIFRLPANKHTLTTEVIKSILRPPFEEYLYKLDYDLMYSVPQSTITNQVRFILKKLPIDIELVQKSEHTSGRK